MRYLRVFLMIATSASAFAQTASPLAHAHGTAGETQWTARYTNCEDGFYVLLPAGVIGHEARASGPNQGFAVNPAAPGSTATFSIGDSQRFIEVLSYYDLEDHGESPSDTIDYYQSLGALSGEKNFVTLGKQSYRLAGLNAKREEVRWVENSVAIRRDRIIAFRPAGGVLYQLTLQSPEKTFSGDDALFNRIVAGFRVSKLPNDGCSSK
jgi:hypothetical protein